MYPITDSPLKVSHDCQQQFSAEYYPTLWRVLPVFEDFMASWQAMLNDPEFLPLHPAISAAMETLEKYYNKTGDSPAHIISMCMASSHLFHITT